MNNTPSEDLYWRLHGLSKILEGSGFIDESKHPDAYATILDAMAFVRGSQPVVREPLTDEQIAEMMRETWGCASIAPRHAMGFARAIEAEVRKQDDALIRQLEEALTDIVEAGEEAWGKDRPCVRIGKEAITAARARRGEKT